MSLRDRCREMINKLHVDGMLRQGSPVDDLMAFVQAEMGRSADARLEETQPVILYFGNEADREEFMATALAALPHFRAKRIP